MNVDIRRERALVTGLTSGMGRSLQGARREGYRGRRPRPHIPNPSSPARKRPEVQSRPDEPHERLPVRQLCRRRGLGIGGCIAQTEIHPEPKNGMLRLRRFWFARLRHRLGIWRRRLAGLCDRFRAWTWFRRTGLAILPAKAAFEHHLIVLHSACQACAST